MRLADTSRYAPELTSIAMVAFAGLVIWPFGEYAILDDWAFAKSLEHLHRDGRVVILDWNPMTLVGHVAWGLAFTKALGFSFFACKMSVISLHAAQCLVLCRLLRMCGVATGMIMAALATFIFHPLVCLHAYTYMTDVPTTAWTMTGVWCYARAMAGQTPRPLVWLLLGSLAVGMAGLVRQPGMLVLAAFATYLAGRPRRLGLSELACAFLPAITMLGVFSWWYQAGHGPTSTFERSMDRVMQFAAGRLWHELPFLGLGLGVYLGLFIAPLAFSLPWRSYALPPGKHAYGWLFLAWGLLSLFAYDALGRGRLFPYMPNCFTRFGFFPQHEFILGEREALWGAPVSWAFSLAGVLAIVVLTRIVIESGSTDDGQCQACTARCVTGLLTMLLAWQFIYLLATSPIQYDRHLLLMGPTAVTLFCLLSRHVGRVNWWAFTVCLAPLALYGLAGSHDIHAISRTAWRAGDDLLREAVDPDQIDAGYAFTAWHMYERSQATPGRGARSSDSWWVSRLAPDVTAKYVVSLSSPIRRGDQRPYKPYRLYHYWSYWPCGWRDMYVLKESTDGS
ncbi:MAG: hypothetical protein WD847_19125 [Pirellulales bacterium]